MDLYCAIFILYYHKISDGCGLGHIIFIKNDKKLTKAETRDKERCILILLRCM